MTSLTILPNTDKKTLKLTGKVAAGEHVAVSVSGGADWIGVGKALRLRVLFGMKQVAMFPLVTEEDAAADTSGETVADAWAAGGEGDADATCTLNLFTIPAEKYLKFGGNCLWVLDDIENNTLYGTGEMEVLPWPKRRGSDVPHALDEYPDIVAELGERIDAAEESISGAVDEANGIVAYVTAAKSDAESSAQTARVARNQAQTAQGKAEDAQAAAEAAQAAAEAALPLDATLAIQGKAADAKAVGDAIALKADKSTTYTKFETYTKTETTNAISTAIATVVDSAPEAFDTLKEIADWIEDDQSGAAAMAAAIKGKVDKVSGKGLSANDYTDAEKSKLAGIAAGAQVNPTPIAPANATESGMFADAYWTEQDLAGKADKVANATAGNLATLDENGNLVDSGNRVAGSFTAGSFIGGGGGHVGFQLDSTDEWVELYIDLHGGVILKFPLHGDTLAVQEDIAPTFDETDTYDEGALVFHNGLYRCVNPNGHTGAWLEADFSRVTVKDVLADKADKVAYAIEGNLAALDSNGHLADSGMALGDFAVAASLAPRFVPYNAYEVGDLCTSFDNDPNHKGTWLYKCILATDGSQLTWPETDPTHWALATVEDLLAAIRTALAGKQDALSAAQLANIAAVPNKADASALRYAMPAAVALVAENDAATLVCADRAVTNATIASGFSTLNLTFPAAVSGYVRDFYLRITVAAGESAPAISVPQGITIENAGGAVPEIADGEASAAATTLVWFSETAPGIFTAKSETVKAVV